MERVWKKLFFPLVLGLLLCLSLLPAALAAGEEGPVQKCELCLNNSCGQPACVAGCPNRAIIYEER